MSWPLPLLLPVHSSYPHWKLPNASGEWFWQTDLMSHLKLNFGLMNSLSHGGLALFFFFFLMRYLQLPWLENACAHYYCIPSCTSAVTSCIECSSSFLKRTNWRVGECVVFILIFTIFWFYFGLFLALFFYSFVCRFIPLLKKKNLKRMCL